MDNYRLCRICISQSESPVMMSIFGEDALWKKITSFANVHIEEGDNLPQQICIACAKNSLDAYSFKQKCEEADSFYRKQLLKRMELRLPDDTEIISISSGSGVLCRSGIEMNGMAKIPTLTPADTRRSMNTNNGNETLNVKKKLDSNREVPMIQNQTQSDQSDYDEDNFPTLIDANAGLSNGGDYTEWGRMNDLEQQSSSSMDDKYDDSLPLIPEIELITPNDDDSNSPNFQNQCNIGEYQCTICFKFFAMKSILKNHIKTCHPDTNSMYHCYGCKKSYLSKRFLEKHIRMGRCVKKRKNTTRPMQCSECGTLFPTGHHLGWHKRTGNCRSRSPKLSLTEYEQRNDSDANDGQENGDDEFNNVTNSEHQKRKKYGKFKQKSGRTRIKLDAKKIAYATELVKQQVSTTKFAQELKISRTFAWRLRKTLENNMYKEGKWNPVKPSSVKNSSTIIGMKMSMPIIAAKNFKNVIPNADVYKKDAININNLSHKFELNSNNDCKIQQQQQCDNSMSLCRSNRPLPYDHIQNNNKIDENQRIQIQPIDNIEMNQTIHNSNMNLLNNNKENKFSCEDNIEKSLKTSEIKKEIDITTPSASSIQQNDQLRKIETNKNEYENSDTNDAENDLQMNQNLIQNASFQPNPNEFLNTMNTLNNYQRDEILKFNKNSQFDKNNTPYNRKPRKPNVFIDEEKYIQGKMLVSNNASTMEIAKILNISQMSAWKLRDCILKNIPITFKNSQPSSELSLTSLTTTTTTPSSILPPFLSSSSSSSSVIKTKKLSNRPKIKVPRLRLRRHERLQRDLIVTKEILEMIKEDRNIQYWKVSERLAAKGFPISPSSVCQRLKSMGIHRRLRPSDRNSIDNKNEQEHEHENEQDQDQVKHQQNDSSVDDEDGIEDDDNDNGDISVNNNSTAIDLSDHSHFLSTHFNNLA